MAQPSKLHVQGMLHENVMTQQHGLMHYETREERYHFLMVKLSNNLKQITHHVLSYPVHAVGLGELVMVVFSANVLASLHSPEMAALHLA